MLRPIGPAKVVWSWAFLTFMVIIVFYPQPGEEVTQPALVIRDEETKMTASAVVPSKGTVHGYPADFVGEFLRLLGYRRIVLRSDQEKSIEALKPKIQQMGFEVVPEENPVGGQ